MKVRFKAGPYDEQMSRVGGTLKGNLTPLKEKCPEGLIVYVLDAGWGRRVEQDEQAAKLLVDLVAPPGHAEIRNLSLWPGAAMLSLHRLDPSDLTAENVQNWLTKLTSFVEHLENLPPPEQSAEESRWDNALRGDRKLIYKIAWLILGSILLLTTIVILGGLWLAIRLN